MDREGFRNRLKQYKLAREENPGLKYWEWKDIPKYDEGTNSVWVPTEEEMLRSKKKNLTDYRSEDFPPMIRFFGEEDHIKNVIRKRVNDPNAFSEKQFLDISDKYYTPFLKDKKIVLTDSENLTGATLSENLLDSIYKYSKIVGIPLLDAVGLAALESTFGKYEGWMDPTSKMSVLAATGDVTQGFDPIKNLHNHTFVDDVYYSPVNEARNWFYRKSPNEHRDTLSVRAAKELETNPNYYILEGVKRYHSVKNPWIHAFELYKHGKYNTNDKHHTSDVQHAGKLVLEDPAVQKWVKEKGIAYAEGTDGVGEPGLWDKFTNTVNVLYNNAARKVKNLFESETTGEVIDLSNQKVSRITPDTKDLTAIYGNEFVENNANNIRTRKQFEETADTLIGDRKIPLSKINNFYGIENGKLKAGDISIFDENTTVIPNRAKKTGKIKEIIFSPVLEHDIDSLRTVINQERLIKKDKLKKLADSLNVDYGNNSFTQIFYGSPSYNLNKKYREALANNQDSEFVKMYRDAIKPSARQISAMNSLRFGNTSYVTESNDTINFQNTAMPAYNKTMYADEYGNAMFINNTNYLSKEQLRLVNEKLKITPMYPILIDNGRYLHYLTDSPNYTTYTSYDFARDPKNIYVIGTTK